MKQYDAILCDFDGVLRHYADNGQAALEREYGLAEGTVLKLAFAPERLTPAILGQITREEWMRSLGEALADLAGPERGLLLADAFGTAPHRLDQEVLALLTQAQKETRVILVTNATTALEDELDQLGLRFFADDVVSSAQVGVAKPDPRIFEIAAERAGVAPERCLFVDDRLENVEAARALGMTGVHFTQVADLAAAL